MSITLNHTIVPARDKEASAKHFAHLFGLKYEGGTGHFAPVKVNDTLTLDFDDRRDERFDKHPYAFHVSDQEFDAIFARVKAAAIAYGSSPWSLEDGQLNNWHGGRGVYFRDLDGHVLELLTRS
jgi:catechol 2,3-dioxygenase-like lactoylglutathione lyase family enzyme